jgi:flagellar basal body-associated protein FliL
MLTIIGIIVLVLVIGAAVYYFGFYKKGKINDRDGDFIPDEVEDGVKEVKRRAKYVKKEIKDVVEAAKELSNQVGDVGKAVKGKKRQGRKAKK